jgi:phenylacetate-coenzyme A ligase PaaK-like adenylate-forming protein
MFGTAIRQVRVTFSTIFGRPFKVDLVEGLVRDALATWDEFGAPGDDVNELLDGPYADPDLAASLVTRAVRRTAHRLDAHSTFYRERFEKSDVDPRRLTVDSMRAVPVTTRADLIERAQDFQCGRAYLSSQTTGTTGRPAQVWYSDYELRLWSALVALSSVLRGELLPDDRLQVSVSSRATLTTHLTAAVCRVIGLPCQLVGLVPATEGLDHLTGAFGPPPTLLQTYPSYLGQLVTAARERGLGPADFALRQINVGGELLSAAVADAARETLGARVADGYAATEVAPAGGRVCFQGHLHPDPNMGYFEVVDLDSDATAGPGELGTLVVTPYHPYRTSMPVFRYDTRDVVRRLPQEPLTCELAGIPAMSPILGKASGLLRTDSGPVTARDVLEVLEALPGTRWPTRFAATPVDGRVRVTLPARYAGGLGPDEIAARLSERDIDSDVDIVPDGRLSATDLRRLRCDLVEQTFSRRES